MRIFSTIIALILFTSCATVPNKPSMSRAEILEPFFDADSSFRDFISNAYGYAVYPSVGKGGFAIGGAFGKGWVFERGRFVGTSELVQVTYGLQIGGKSYSEIVVFENARAFKNFKEGHLQLSAQISAVALGTGASKNVPYRNGVAIFTANEQGLMGEISVGGQRFSFEPGKL